MARTPSNIDFNPDRLEEILKNRKIKISSLCKNCNFSYESYKVYMRDRRINPDILDKIARSLKVSYDYLRGHSVHMSKTIPFGKDYILDKDGYVIPPYKSQNMDDISKHMDDSLTLFDKWFNNRKWFDHVNQKLVNQGKKPIQRKDFNQFLDLYRITYEDIAVEHILETMVTDIERKRNAKTPCQ